MRYGLYTPTGWDRSTPLPLVVLLHGASDDETAVDRRSVISALDDAIESGLVPPVVIVAPDGERGFWVNWHDGSHRYRDWVLDEVIPDVRAKHAIAQGPDSLHLMGVSMGGGGGMQMWLWARPRFASATILSAPILREADTRDFLDRFTSREVVSRIFGPEDEAHGIDPFAALSSPAGLGGSRLIIGAARYDLGQILESNERFHDHLVAHRVPHRFVTFSGFHRWDSWAPVFAYALCHQLQARCDIPDPEGWSIQTD